LRQLNGDVQALGALETPIEIISQEIVRGGLLNLLHHRSGVKADLVFRKSNKHAIHEFSRRHSRNHREQTD